MTQRELTWNGAEEMVLVLTGLSYEGLVDVTFSPEPGWTVRIASDIRRWKIDATLGDTYPDIGLQLRYDSLHVAIEAVIDGIAGYVPVEEEEPTSSSLDCPECGQRLTSVAYGSGGMKRWAKICRCGYDSDPDWARKMKVSFPDTLRGKLRHAEGGSRGLI